jgi:hypothetical protein
MAVRRGSAIGELTVLEALKQGVELSYDGDDGEIHGYVIEIAFFDHVMDLPGFSQELRNAALAQLQRWPPPARRKRPAR